MTSTTMWSSASHADDAPTAVASPPKCLAKLVHWTHSHAWEANVRRFTSTVIRGVVVRGQPRQCHLILLEAVQSMRVGLALSLFVGVLTQGARANDTAPHEEPDDRNGVHQDA